MHIREGNRGGGGNLQDSAYDALLASTLEYLYSLERIDDAWTISAVSLDGTPAIKISSESVLTEDSAGAYTSDIYLDESYLPMRVDVEGNLDAGVELRVRYDYDIEFLLREELPLNFFSIHELPDGDLSRFSATCTVME